ncbi:MAG: esterase-like activity of phytase family protein [Burkholderiales bacterium]|nr:esterase-like activity of phytase family protein [Burkholderiales bacterium]
MPTCPTARRIAPRAALSCLAAAVLAALPGPAAAQFTSGNRDVLTANTGAWPAGGVSLGGTTFVNLGLQGVGRIAANATDPATGETLGSISDMQITGFTSNGNGTWSGTFHFLPDRGYNSGATFSNYAARVNTFSFTFTPYTGAAPAAGQNQIAMSFTGSTRFTYDHDANPLTAPVYTTGLLANGTAALFGTTVPVVTGATTQSDGTVTNRLTLDTEGLVLDNRAGKAGTGWVSDEYGAYIYRFDAGKRLTGQVQLPAALVPHAPVGTVNFAADANLNGRRTNQGLEGLAQSPSGNRLFALEQSATLQDSGSGNVGRSNTRLMVFDVSGSDTPAGPAAQYVIQLPRVDDNGGTPAVNRTAAQSAIVALNDHQLLILSRDGNGRGAAGSPVFKSILLADLNGATPLAGFDAEGAAVAPGGVLNANVTPIQWTEALNLLGKLGTNPASELSRFGLNLNTAPGDINTLSEKWEALSLVPVGDGSGQYFLFVGNDNDFMSQTGSLIDAAGNLVSYNAGLENDTMVLAFRVAAVPEPETYALLLAGLGVVGALARRRSRRPA